MTEICIMAQQRDIGHKLLVDPGLPKGGVGVAHICNVPCEHGV